MIVQALARRDGRPTTTSFRRCAMTARHSALRGPAKPAGSEGFGIFPLTMRTISSQITPSVYSAPAVERHRGVPRSERLKLLRLIPPLALLVGLATAEA